MADRKKQVDWAAFFVRLPLGIVFLYHGAQMLFGAFDGPGLETTAYHVNDHLGFRPEKVWALFFGGGVFLSGLFLSLGLFSRPAAVAAGIAAGLGLFWQNWNLVIFNNQELPLPYALLLLAVAVSVYYLGAGNLSIDRKIARERADARE
jgi:putative oxidoreductase